MQGRSLRRWERALAFSVVGVAGEVGFTGARDSLLRKQWRLRGHSYLWMFPIYGLSTYAFEPVHDLLRERVWWQRALAYSLGIMGVEFVAGMVLRRSVGVVPWDYTGHGRFVIPGGATRLDYAPIWGVVGLALERLDEGFDDGTQERRLPPGARARAPIVVERLALEYGEAHTELAFTTPWQLLVSVILSAQTTDVTVNAVTPVLFARFATPEALATAPQGEVEEIIHRTGFFHSKARAIIEMSQDLILKHGGEVPSTMEALVTLRGVGRKTANVVLGVAFGVPGFAVDTHVARLTGLLRLTSATDPVKIEEDVCSIVPPTEWTNLSLRLILHGRRICIANRPRCHLCVLASICPSAQLGLTPASKPRRRSAKAGR